MSKRSYMTNEAVHYALKQLFRIANPAGTIHYEAAVEPDSVLLHFPESPLRFRFRLADDGDWHRLAAGEQKLASVKAADGTREVPLLFPGDLFPGDLSSAAPFTSRDGDEIHFNADILSATVFLLSRWEETLDSPRDAHGRYRYEGSTAERYGFVDVPVVDEYALLLKQSLVRSFPLVDPGTNTFRIQLSHDIDDIHQFRSAGHAFRLAGKALWRHTPRPGPLLRDALQAVKDPARDPTRLGILDLAAFSLEHGLDSAFYFMAADRSREDSGYETEALRHEIDWLQEQGFEIGFHPGYSTVDYERLLLEKERMDRIIGRTDYGGRQHFLRFTAPDTWQNWARAGLSYDSTLGFAEHEGFRCGTCHPYRPFAVKENRELDILELPLIAMDGTLRTYRQLSTKDAADSLRRLIGRCRAVEGVFTMLWHNTSTYHDWEPWYHDVYKQVLGEVTQ